MAKKQPVSFDEIIQSDRQKKQNELLANQLLGKDRHKKGRRASAPGAGGVSKVPSAKPGSLASRIGVPKRAASATLQTKQTKQSKQAKPPNPAPATVPSSRTRTKPNTKRNQNTERLAAAIESGSSQANIRQAKPGLSIKGASGPFVVVGSNFAPGTTAADIQSALEPVSGPMLSCRVIGHHPIVTAEITYAEKWTAENVVANLHNQRADGRVLSMKLKPVGSDAHISSSASFDHHREQADRERRNRRAEPITEDGTYGFSKQGSRNHQSSGLYSDQMMVDAPARNRRRHW